MKKRLRTVQPAHWSPNLTPERVRAAWLKTYADLGIDLTPPEDGPASDAAHDRADRSEDRREDGG